MRPYYEDAAVTIYHGDCRRDWTRREFADLGFDVIVTDPPYGMGYVHGTYGGGRSYGFEQVAIAGDDEPFDPSAILALGVPTVLFGANHYADRLPAARGWLVWDKRVGRGSTDQSDAELAWTDQSDAELAWTNVLGVVRVKSLYWGGAVRTGREQAEGRVHVTQKPVALMAWALDFMPPGTVLDPYMGSGSTLVAAKQAGRKSIGIEIEERYCEIAANRCSQEVPGLVSA